MNNPSFRNTICYNPERIDYSLSGEELEMIKNANQNDWKDYSILCFGFGVPCLLNSFLLLSQKGSNYLFNFNINFIFGAIGIVLGIVFLSVWNKTKKNLDKIVNDIKNKPKIEFTPHTSNTEEN